MALSRIRAALFRFGGWLRKERTDAAFNEELESHLRLSTEAKVAAGMEPGAARVAAEREFGGWEQMKEAYRDERRNRWLEELEQDLRWAFRMLRKNPGFATVTILIIALGIGATTSIFSMVNSVVLRPLPYPHPERLFVISEVYRPTGDSYGTSMGVFRQWQTRASSFSSLAADRYWPANVAVGDYVTRRGGRAVTPGYFSTYGVTPYLGRDFLPEEYTAEGRGSVVILNYKLWVELFNSDPGVIGQLLKVNDESCTIVGVMPPSFLPQPITDPGIFRPLVTDAAKESDLRNHPLIEVLGRLQPGATPERANAELQVISSGLAAQFPAERKDWGQEMKPLLETKIGEVRPFLLLLLAAVGVLLLIACVNVANLLLARASARQREIALRVALGAGRGRIIRQLLAESLVVSLVGGLLGVILAWVSLRALLTLAPLELPRSAEITVDGPVLLFACLLAVLTGIGFGLLPALRASRVNLSDAMKAGAGGGDVRGGQLRGALVASEIALALVLLSAAGLLMNSFLQLQRVPLGFDMGNTRVAKFAMSRTRYDTPEKQRLLVRRVLDKLGAVPGVHSIAFGDNAPGWGRWPRNVRVEGQASDPAAELLVSCDPVTSDYFKVMGIALRRGRVFDPHDNETAPMVAIVSEDFAARNFPHGDALGRRVRIDRGTDSHWSEIVGIVAKVYDAGPADSAPPQVYEPFDQNPDGSPNLFIRSEGFVRNFDRELRQALNQIDASLPLPDTGRSLMEFYNNLIAPQRFSLFLFGIFSLSALGLCAMGTYGVVSYSVAQRTKEIGIRMAIGAQPGDIRRLVFTQAGAMVGIGLVIGLVGALATTHLLQALLYQVTARDPATLIEVLLVLTGTALVACWFPAYRATRVDPLVALRTE